MTRFETYTLRRLLVPMVAISYTLGAIYLKPTTNAETFPFFNWSLFSSTAAKRSDAAILVRMIDGRQLDPPSLYYDMPETFGAALRRDVRLVKASQRMARAIMAGDEITARATRQLIEHTFMREAAEAHYDLAIITYDPVDRLRTGTIETVNVLATFEKVAQ